MAKQPTNDAILRAVGGALSNWSLVELDLATLFANLSKAPRAHIIFGAIISFEARLAVCDKLVAADIPDELDRELWVKLSGRLSKYYKKRHELAHFSVSVDDKEGWVIKPFLTTDKIFTDRTTSLTLAQIKERSAKFLDLHSAVGWFATYAVLQRVGKQERRIKALQEPPLVAQLRALAIQSLEERKAREQKPKA